MEFSHHALICRSDDVKGFCLPETRELQEYHDIYVDSLGVESVKNLIKRAYNKPNEYDLQCIIVRTDFITHEAQNALLKVVEEPPMSTRFVFVVPNDLVILPTLLSRLSFVTSSSSNNLKNDFFDVFLSQSYKDRINTIEKMIKDKNLTWQRNIKIGLIEYVKRSKSVNNLKELEYISRWLLTRGASNKMLLEQLALILPICTK